MRDALLHLEKQKASLEKTQKSMRDFELKISGMRRVADLTNEYLGVETKNTFLRTNYVCFLISRFRGSI